MSQNAPAIAAMLFSTFALAACAGDPPSCQQALTHYYGVGCSYYNANTGAQIPFGEMLTFCQQVAIQGSGPCQDALDDWLVCMEEVRGGTNAGCDCSQSFMGLLRACS